MNAELLLKHFDRISDAPNAVSRLRQFVLTLAVTGRLVDRTVLSEIPAESGHVTFPTELVDRGPTGGGQPGAFTLPDGWRWVRLDEIALKISDGEHLSPKKATTGMPLLSAMNVTSDGVSLFFTQFVDWADGVRFRERCDPNRGDILICSRGTIGRCALVETDEIFCLMGSVIQVRLSSVCSPRYAQHVLSTDSVQSRMRGMSGATAVKALYLRDLRSCLLPLPPLAEQHRIVARVDELMALCDRLEEARKEREARRDRLTAASIHHLNKAAPGEDLRKHARFFINHLPKLTARPDQITPLRNALLDWGSRGLLTTEWRDKNESGHSASNELNVIMQSRRKVWEDRRSTSSGRKYVPGVHFDDSHLPAIPASWTWASCDSVCSQITDGEHIQPPYQNEGLPMLTAKHVRDGHVVFDGAGLISAADFEKSAARCRPEEGDLLVVSVGATTGRAAIVNQDRPFVLVRSVLLLKPLMSAYFLLRWFQSPWCLCWMRQASEASAQPHLYINDTRRMPVPIPPLAEQLVITAKIDELLSLSGQLEENRTTTREQAGLLLTRLLHA